MSHPTPNAGTINLLTIIELAARMNQASWNGNDYTMSLPQATVKAADLAGEHPAMADIACMLLVSCWNDVLDLAARYEPQVSARIAEIEAQANASKGA